MGLASPYPILGAIVVLDIISVVPLYMAVTCSVPEEYSTCLFWETSSGYAVFGASWFDSGYMLLPVYVCFWYCFRIQRNACSSVLHALRQYWAGSWKKSTIFYEKGYTRLLRSILVLLFSGQVQFLVMILTCPLLCMSRSLLFPVVAQRQSPWSRQFVRRWISQLQYTMADVSVVQVVQALPRRCAETVSMAQTVRLTMDIPSCSARWPMSLLSWSCRFTSSSCAEAVSHGQPVCQTIEISQLQYALGGQCSC